MKPVIILDSGPLGLLTKPVQSAEVVAINLWLDTLLADSARVIVPEIADYEIRRELLRTTKTAGLARLDNLNASVEYLPITTSAMRQAAHFWAQARQQGRPTAGDKTIDADMILAAQAVTLNVSNFIIATVNVKHFANFVPADFWQNIS